MITKKHLAVAAMVAGVGTLGIVGLAAADATKPASLAFELAQKFNLKESEVQGVIDQHHKEVQSAHEDRYEERLTKAVANGKLTSDQKDQILAKHKELMTAMAGLKGKSPAEMKAALKQQRADIRAWEQAHTIPPGYLGAGDLGHEFGHRFKGGMHQGA